MSPAHCRGRDTEPWALPIPCMSFNVLLLFLCLPWQGHSLRGLGTPREQQWPLLGIFNQQLSRQRASLGFWKSSTTGIPHGCLWTPPTGHIPNNGMFGTLQVDPSEGWMVLEVFRHDWAIWELSNTLNKDTFRSLQLGNNGPFSTGPSWLLKLPELFSCGHSKPGGKVSDGAHL